MRVFLSYRRDDLGGHIESLVGRLYDRLSQRYGSDSVFVDEYSIPPGEEFATFIAAQIARADLVLVVIGPDWLGILERRASGAEDHVRAEIAAALEQSKTLIPVLVGGATMPVSGSPCELSSRIRSSGAPEVGFWPVTRICVVPAERWWTTLSRWSAKSLRASSSAARSANGKPSN